MKISKGGLATAALGCFIAVFGADSNRGWQRVETRQQIISDWNQDDVDEQFYVSGIVNEKIHVVLHGALSADADRILDGMTTSQGLVNELLKDGFTSVECGGRAVTLKPVKPAETRGSRELDLDQVG
jgi:hypothetical protein